jgi:hypothetical protein
MGNFSVLDSLNEQGEFKNKGISDAEKASITATTKGNIITISRQADRQRRHELLQRRCRMRMGRAAALSVEVDVYALLAQNAGLGPTMPYDGTTLFHANHGNITTGAALVGRGARSDRVAMASQKEPNGNDYIDLRPAVLVIAGRSRRPGEGHQPVAVRPRHGREQVADEAEHRGRPLPRRRRHAAPHGTRRYLFADPGDRAGARGRVPRGQTSPVLETQDGWRVDGAEMKVRFDYGVAAVDYRGAVTNAGV